MLYIPNEWIINKENENRIYELLKSADTDLIAIGETPVKDLLKELEEIGETIIASKIKDGTIKFG